jgi:flavoprotein hydroxylase
VDAPFDVAIVGWGPVGQTLAILLGQRGWRVRVLEKQPAPYPLPRAVHFDHEVARILQGAGLGDELPRLSEPADVYEWRNAAGDVLLRIGTRDAALSGWPEANMFSQPELERALDARARALPTVDVRRGAEVVGVAPAADDVELEAGGARVRARWLVGCDGANSVVRRQLGVTITDLGFFFDWLIVDVVPREPRTWVPINGQVCDPARPTTVVSGGPGRRRWEFMRLPGESLTDLDTEATAWRLLEPWALHPGNATLERHAVYRFQARWVDGWRKGRVLLAGDAAHQMPPFAGQGMCSGIRDAANLAWKLDLVLAGSAGETLLDSYASERIPQVQRAIEWSMQLGKVICVTDPAEAAARDAAMTETARATGLAPPPPSPAIGPGVLLADDPRAGRLFPQGRVRRGGVAGRFDDVVGRGFVLLGATADPSRVLPPDLARFFASVGGIGAHVARGGPVDDVDGTYGRWFAEHGVELALQRPDFHVFGTAPRLEGAADVVRALRDSLPP